MKQVVYCRRELHAIAILLGMVANAALGKGLKRLIRQARPLAGCELLGSCTKHGMPSSHVQVRTALSSHSANLTYRSDHQRDVNALCNVHGRATILRSFWLHCHVNGPSAYRWRLRMELYATGVLLDFKHKVSTLSLLVLRS